MMPLSGEAFPYQDPETGQAKVWDGGQAYDVDPNGQVITPEGIEIPWWGEATPEAPAQPAGVPPVKSNLSPTPPAQAPYQLPALNVQPGLTQQNWEATYNLALAQEKRLREALETIDQPKARALIDQAIQEIRMNQYGAQTTARESQAKMTGVVPQWLPQIPQFQQGAYKDYQVGGLVAPPGSAIGGPSAGTPPAMDDDQAAMTIWNSRPDIQQMYKSEHPDWQPVQAVKDWWTFAPHEGAGTLVDYARLKGYLMA